MSVEQKTDLDMLREAVERDGLQDFVKAAPVEELVARQEAEITRLRAALTQAKQRFGGMGTPLRTILSVTENPLIRDNAEFVMRSRDAGRDECAKALKGDATNA